MNVLSWCQKRLLDFPCCNAWQFLIASLMQLQIHLKRLLQTVQTVTYHQSEGFFNHVCVALSQGPEEAGTNWNMGNCISTCCWGFFICSFVFYFSPFDEHSQLGWTKPWTSCSTWQCFEQAAGIDDLQRWLPASIACDSLILSC